MTTLSYSWNDVTKYRGTRALDLSVFDPALLLYDEASRVLKSFLAKILVFQKRALRFILSAERNEHAIPFFTDADIPGP